MIYDPEQGELLKEQGIAKVEKGADEELIKWFRRALKGICLVKQQFTADSLHLIAVSNSKEVPEARLYGAVLNYGKKRGWCFPTERHVKSKRKEAHSRPIRVWESKIWKGYA